MNNINITISKGKKGKVQYLTEILPEIPTHTILYKKLTGLGATYGELKADRNSVIIEPNKPVISGKCKDPKHKGDNLFGVFEGVYTEDVVAYMEKSMERKKHFKILTTPESFCKVQQAFEELELDIRFHCFLMFDECHKIVKDSNFRPDITLPMDLFFECEHKALVSATPIEFTDPRFEEQGFQTITIVPTFDYKKEIHLHTTNNLLQATKEVFALLNADRCFIFCNSTDTIYALMCQLNLLDESAVYCSEKSVEKLKNLKFSNTTDVWDAKMMKRYNWMTSRFYNAVDIELTEKPTVIMLTDCYFADYTVFDPNTDAVQCAGRFRNGVASIHHISNTNHNFLVRSKDELKGYVACSKDLYYMLQNLYSCATTISVKDAYREAIEILSFANLLYKNGKVNYFAIDNLVNERLVKGYYHSSENLMKAFQNCDMFIPTLDVKNFVLGDYERLKRNSKTNDIKEKRKIMVEQLELLGTCETELEYSLKRDLIATDSFIVEAYDKIGKAEIERLNYSRKKIKEAIILADYREKARGTEILKLIYNAFECGKWYSSKSIKSELTRIYALVNLVPKKAITSHTICDFFEAVEKKKGNKRGYELIKERMA